MFAFATSSPATRAQLKQGTAFAYNFAEFILRRFPFNLVPTIDLCNQ
ncbi:hypothetical protein RSAG8_01555, partial [Rhizoctonia solani AG-8 WAC10335]